jgi:peptidoglycan/xylan/chitin deacetylase (PgdA/CDA1 family)/SAM-dependent methyltransferase
MSMREFYTGAFYEGKREGARRSAEEILPLVLDWIHPQNVVDVGCGTGTWLSVCHKLGIHDYLGIDGEHVQETALEIGRERFCAFDLTNPVRLGRRFDLVMSLEVAEHLPRACAPVFIESLTSLGPVVLFSAAVPLQGGENHLNEQWPEYWARLFRAQGYLVIDCLRDRVWANPKVEPWYAQNVFLYMRESHLASFPGLETASRSTDPSRLARVHPRGNRKGCDGARAAAEAPQAVHYIDLEVTQPITSIRCPDDDRLVCHVWLEGIELGSLALPVVGGVVPAYLLEDAVAARFAWAILGRFFAATIYGGGRAARQSGGHQDGGPAALATLHDDIGWATFLQELWGRPGWPASYFYDPALAEPPATTLTLAEGGLTYEVSDDPPEVRAAGRRRLPLVVTLGGIALGTVTVQVKDGRVRGEEIRAAVTAEIGFELCRGAVREALLGRPFDDGSSLRARLRAGASRVGEARSPLAELGLAPSLGCALGPQAPLLLLTRRHRGTFGTSACRRAELPSGAAADLLDAARAAGEPVTAIPASALSFARVFYAPELIPPTRMPQWARAARWARALARRGRRVLQNPLRSKGTSDLRQERIVRAVELMCAARDQRAMAAVATERLPILLYHRVTDVEQPATAAYRVRPQALEEHLRFLRDAGYYAIRLETWRLAMAAATPLPGKAIVLTFEGAYEEILTEVWPLLKRYGFGATVLVTVETVGKRAFPDDLYGERVTYLGWRELRRLQAGGVELGSLSYGTRPLTALSSTEIVRDAVRSRIELERHLGRPVRIFAYPHGHTDACVQHWIGACGYVFGLSCRPSRSSFGDSLLDLPRIEVVGAETLAELAACLQW